LVGVVDTVDAGVVSAGVVLAAVEVSVVEVSDFVLSLLPQE